MGLIAEGDRIEDLGSCEDLLSEGQSGEVRIYLDRNLTNDEIYNMEQGILSQGVVLTSPIVQDAGIVSIKFRKELAPLAIIAIVVGVAAAGIMGWQLFAPEWGAPLGIPVWVWLAGGGALAYLMLKKPAAKAAPGALTYIITPGRKAVKAKAALEEYKR